MAESSVEVLKFKDEKPVPDKTFDYPVPDHGDGKVPVVIDNGSCSCRVGWATDDKPKMIFRNVTAKQRGKKENELQIGNDIVNIDVIRWILRSQFDRNVVTTYDVQEQIFDHIFTHLGVNSEGSVEHPMVLTEAVVNPNYCRQQMSELLFECYSIPSVCYGVDSLFSFFHNYPEAKDGVILDCGYQTTHVLPVLDGRLASAHCRRINVGGAHADFFLQRLLQLKYPGHSAALTLSRAEELQRDHTYYSQNYRSELSKWAETEHYLKNVRRFQLPFTPLPGSQMSAEQQKERREQQIMRLKEANRRRRMEKLREDEEELQRLMAVQDLMVEEDDEAFDTALRNAGFQRVEDLQSAVDKLTLSVQRAQAKILGIEPPPLETENKESSFPLLDIPDEMLTRDQLEVKKRQRILKSAQQGRAKAQALQRERRQKELVEERRLEQRRQCDFQGWLTEIRQKRNKILDARNTRRQKKANMAKRGTLASQERMRIISQLAAQNKKKDDNFGQNDDDWDVYKEINTEQGTSDSEAEDEKLEELETVLKEHDPEFQKELDMGGISEMNLAEYFQVHVGVERTRAPELLFQPSMLGMEQAGLAETLNYVLTKFDLPSQKRLCQNVFLTGGMAQVPGLKERMERELLETRPFQSSFNVTVAGSPVLDGWTGARHWALSPQLGKSSITRAQYQEMGEGYFTEHRASNRFFPTPGAKGK
ncbi:actin-related protein 5-like [Babylonia areolata]|uniref:actin-related protein 5-like n=1 Tax=Babylonia areolata TaxID=304850 RepID=UPI003FD661DF